MTTRMKLDGLAPPEEGVFERQITQEEATATGIVVSFEPLTDGLPEIPAKVYRFSTSIMAKDFLTEIMPSAKAYGSPKQAKAKRAAKLRVPLEVLDNYSVTYEVKPIPANTPVEGAKPDVSESTRGVRPPRDATRTGAPNRASVPSGPVRPDPGGLASLIATLSEPEAELPEEGDGEAEDGYELPDDGTEA